MSTRELTLSQKAGAGLAVMTMLVLVVGAGLLLQEYGPGNMGTGFLQGAALALVASLVMFWRVARRPHRATTFERAFTQTGDERDDAMFTQALAVLGLVAFPLTGVAAVAIGLGSPVSMTLFLLLVAQLVVGATAYVVISRRG